MSDSEEALLSELVSYCAGRRDSVRERRLARRLRGLPEPVRFRVVSALLDRSHVGLMFALPSNLSPSSSAVLLKRGLREADASTIREWLRASSSRLGPERLLTLLESNVDALPHGVEGAVYWLREFLPKPLSLDHQQRVTNLVGILKRLGVFRTAIVREVPADQSSGPGDP